MANVKITDLPPVLGLTGAEQFECVQAGTSSRTTADQIVNLFSGDVSLVTATQANLWLACFRRRRAKSR